MAMQRSRVLAIGRSSAYDADARRRQILRDIAEVEQDLKSAWRQLNETTDEDLIDSAIYMVRAAEIKYGALIRMLKNSS